MINLVYTDVKFANQIKYTFNIILSTLGIECEILPYSDLSIDKLNNRLLISYGHKKPDIKVDYHIHIYQSKLFSEDYMKPESMPQLPLKHWSDLPIIYDGNGDIRDFVVRDENKIETNIDIIASSFFMLSRYEEYLVDERDQYDRFPESASVAYKEGFLTRPIVNEYIELLWQWIDSFNLGFKRKRLWGNKDFAACLTHDIDYLKRTVYQEIRYWAILALKKHKPIKAIDRAYKASIFMLKGKNPYWNYDEIMSLEENYGFTSSFYFFGGGKHPFDATYSIHNEKTSCLLNNIKNRGHEVGLHGSFESCNNLEMLAEEKTNLEKVVGEIQGIRQHFLRFNIRKTFDIYDQIGIKYDVTLSYAQHEGFRAGFCLPFHPYNIKDDCPHKVIEIPLIIMDGTLGEIYMNYNQEQAWKSIEYLLYNVKRYNGCIVLLFHNTRFTLSYPEYMIPEYKLIYDKCLRWISENNGIGLSAKECIQFR